MADSNGTDNVYSIAQKRESRLRRNLKTYGAVDLSEIIAVQSEIAQAGLDLKRLVDVVTRRSQALTRSTGAVVELLDGTDLFYWSGSGSVRKHEGLRIPVSGSLSGLCITKGTVLRCRDSETDTRVDRDACRQVGLRSALVTPLQCNGELVGVLKVVSDKPNAYTDRHVHLLETLAAFTGSMLHSALAHARLAEDMQRKASAEASARTMSDAGRSRLEGLIGTGGITPVFQPIVEIATKRIVGHEALSRFPADTKMTVDAWFELAERVGMCFELEVACISAIVDAVMGSSPMPGYISLNVSPRTLLEYDFERLPDRRAQGGWVLELTEHTQVNDYTLLAARVKHLQARGLRIAIDDAGAGFSSLRHVLRLAPDIVKLDLSIIRDIDTIRRHQLLASAIISFSRDTGIDLVAEGVETASEQDTLTRLGVPYGQGYLFGRPSPLPG